MVTPTTVREIPESTVFRLTLKSVVMRYLMMFGFSPPVLFRAIFLSFQLRLDEEECSHSVVE
jgi:hypothetical protein